MVAQTSSASSPPIWLRLETAADRRVGSKTAVFRRFAPLQQGIVLKPVVHFALQFEAGHLQDAQRLLQALIELLGLLSFNPSNVMLFLCICFCVIGQAV